ncbi:AP-3 complex subunit sigma-1 isoform X7 [Chiloscyllium plagiosum]|uniref:AP-3 complex subunit sigma-1 isoform X7 n=1 Tax=Chiloscyllium plagiosum TaxID=36176 RepID=UPI001CB87CE7|nr:AP-3 complex subunit sigma-1 isoform X7 [Chiloscyllium plagiosum]
MLFFRLSFLMVLSFAREVSICCPSLITLEVMGEVISEAAEDSWMDISSEDTQQQIIRETFHLVSKRDENVCNFLEGGMLIGGADNKLIYRHYATLYFVFCVDSSESELGILDLIQVFVETLDKCFENVCELDLIFHVDKVHNILAEMVMGGMVLETNMNEIVTQIDAQNKMEKSETFIFQSPRLDR